MTDRINLTPVAIREGHVLADRLFGGGAARRRSRECRDRGVHHARRSARSGLTERDALERYGVIDIYKTNFRPMKATLTGGGERTIMKLVVDAASDRVSARISSARKRAK